MDIHIDPNDYCSLLAAVHRFGRELEPTLHHELPVLLAPKAPSCLARVADASRARKLHERFPRAMLPTLIESCTKAINGGMMTHLDWFEAGYSDGGVDWAFRTAAAAQCRATLVATGFQASLN